MMGARENGEKIRRENPFPHRPNLENPTGKRGACQQSWHIYGSCERRDTRTLSQSPSSRCHFGSDVPILIVIAAGDIGDALRLRGNDFDTTAP